ncbi:MAG: class II glutamine amidotransferase [Lachnospiraceae bacterium]|nr:class II glutamine amidotransferase [Lachnospiraceae bacterium]
MCELFGFSSKKKFPINEYLKEFYSHSDEHPHGWGLVRLEGNEAFIEKEPVKASESTYLKERLKAPIESRNVFAHIRYATIGNVDYRNCHPYTRKDSTGRRWTQVHNGTIFDYGQLDSYFKLQEGDTDSERILMYLVDKINGKMEELGRKPKARECFSLLDGIISDMAKGNKLNMMLYDGEYMYIHTNYKNSLYYLEKDGSVLFSTQPLSTENWKPVPFTTLLVYCDGKLVFTGTNHGNEYIDNEENLKLIYQAFSNL